MSHDFHERLPGFDPQQILVDGCRECEARSKRNDHGIGSLDRELFIAAWERAQEWQTQGLDTISDAERPLLDTLWSVHLATDRAGVCLGPLLEPPAERFPVDISWAEFESVGRRLPLWRMICRRPKQ